MLLASKEQGRADVITNGKALRCMEVLRAHCDYKDYRERVFVAEEVRSSYKSLGMELTSEDLSRIEAKMLEWTELEKKARLKAPKTDRWKYDNGAVSENFREGARLCVVEAGRALPDYTKGKDPEDFWLHRLYVDLLDNNSDLLFAASQEGGMIVSVCVASATFCARLARKTPAGELVLPKPPTAVQLTDRERNIWEVIQRVAGGRQYCHELDNAGIAPPRKGVWKDGPRKYLAAFGLGKPWRHRIEDEKSKIRRKIKAAKLAGVLASE